MSDQKLVESEVRVDESPSYASPTPVRYSAREEPEHCQQMSMIEQYLILGVLLVFGFIPAFLALESVQSWPLQGGWLLSGFTFAGGLLAWLFLRQFRPADPPRHLMTVILAGGLLVLQAGSGFPFDQAPTDLRAIVSVLLGLIGIGIGTWRGIGWLLVLGVGNALLATATLTPGPATALALAIGSIGLVLAALRRWPVETLGVWLISAIGLLVAQSSLFTKRVELLPVLALAFAGAATLALGHAQRWIPHRFSPSISIPLSITGAVCLTIPSPIPFVHAWALIAGMALGVIGLCLPVGVLRRELGWGGAAVVLAAAPVPSIASAPWVQVGAFVIALAAQQVSRRIEWGWMAIGLAPLAMLASLVAVLQSPVGPTDAHLPLIGGVLLCSKFLFQRTPESSKFVVGLLKWGTWVLILVALYAVQAAFGGHGEYTFVLGCLLTSVWLGPKWTALGVIGLLAWGWNLAFFAPAVSLATGGMTLLALAASAGYWHHFYHRWPEPEERNLVDFFGAAAIGGFLGWLLWLPVARFFFLSIHSTFLVLASVALVVLGAIAVRRRASGILAMATLLAAILLFAMPAPTEWDLLPTRFAVLGAVQWVAAALLAVGFTRHLGGRSGLRRAALLTVGPFLLIGVVTLGDSPPTLTLLGALFVGMVVGVWWLLQQPKNSLFQEKT